MLELSHITVSYGAQRALNKVSFTVEAGDIVGVVGPNGAGKTTLFKAIMQLIEQDEGTFVFNGAPISKSSSKEIAYLPEAPFQFEFFTPLETLLFERAVKNPLLPLESIDEMLQRFDLEFVRDTPLKNLSQGLKKRVALAAIFVGTPSLIILDEPLNALDIQTVIVLKDSIAEAAARGAHILLSSHVLTFFDGLVDKIVFLEHGLVRALYSGDAKGAEEKYKELFMSV